MVTRQLHSAVFGACGLEDESLVEISGPADSGKSLVLQQMVAHCLAPYEFGGRQWSVLLINLSHKISRESLTRSMTTELRSYSGGGAAEESPPEEQLAEIARECVRRVRFLNCFSTEDLKTALIDARYAIINDPAVQLIALDTLSEFYWLDWPRRTKNLSRFRHYRMWQTRLEKTCKEAVVCGMYTVDSDFLDNRHGEHLPEVHPNYHVRMQKIRGRNTLNGRPLAFNNGVYLDS
ncbi:uncharacterized protein LOC128264340 [Drosophila gunungcola]|uniref:DNA repair protein XRCC2 n=1 Tax=Drosophila gunungcola TaxID=103775 RepID=A0A9P9YDM9_9MUSC|nr:uncharacterized protein LOC128264340 [Drosophila gunungcola]KAI8034574.1 hypothetical protein M5D96_012627 [Drosophila gunungcola]